MPESPALLTFILASIALVVVPGPAVFYIVARSVSQGRLAGLVSVLGITVGTGLHIVAAAFGLSAILAASPLAFITIKYLGAGYLLYLGISTLRRHESRLQPANPDHPAGLAQEVAPLGRIFGHGIVVNILNPKAALFLLAFLPQFADPGRGPVATQILLLGLVFVAIAVVSDGTYALLAGQVYLWLNRRPRWRSPQRWLSGLVYLLLGLAALVAGTNGV